MKVKHVVQTRHKTLISHLSTRSSVDDSMFQGQAYWNCQGCFQELLRQEAHKRESSAIYVHLIPAERRLTKLPVLFDWCFLFTSLWNEKGFLIIYKILSTQFFGRTARKNINTCVFIWIPLLLVVHELVHILADSYRKSSCHSLKRNRYEVWRPQVMIKSFNFTSVKN